MTIRNLSLYTTNLIDWGVFSECFSDGCQITDQDGRLERRGQFLDIEWKGPNVAIKSGLARTLNRYTENGHHTPLILWGEPGRYRQLCLYCGNPTCFDKEPPSPIQMQIWPNDPMPCDLGLVKEFMRDWYRWADDQPVPLIGAGRILATTNRLSETVVWSKRWQQKRR